MTPTLMPQVTSARPLGPRGSRRQVGSADPAAELTAVSAAVLAAIPAWWSAQASRVGLSGKWLDVHKSLNIEPPLVLGETPPLEPDWGHLTADQIGINYVTSLAAETRARHGRHYTPRMLSNQLWSMTRHALGFKRSLSPLPGLIRDPACGAGALLLAPLREHLRASQHINPRIVLAGLPSLIEGIDTDPAAVWVANIVLASQMLPYLAQIPERDQQPLPTLARVGDGLAEHPTPARAIVMNPPYGRVRLDPQDRQRFKDTLYGHANLYGMFMATATDSLDAHGVLSALVPTSFTSGRYFGPLREHLTKQSRLQNITFITDRTGVFDSVLQETCLATFTKRKIRKTRVEALGSKLEQIAVVSSPTTSLPWVLPRRTDLAPVAAASAKLPNTLASVGWKVTTGPLVWNRRRADLYSHPGADRYRVVWASDIELGSLQRSTMRSAMRYMKLHTERDRQIYLQDTPGILVQRTTAPEQRRRLVLTELTSKDFENGGVVVENHVNVLRPTGDTLAISQRLLAQILMTPTLDRLVRCISGSVALSAYELEMIRLPDTETLARWELLDEDTLRTEISNVYERGTASR